jgi:Mrp family chromosome partitioning ATPase
VADCPPQPAFAHPPEELGLRRGDLAELPQPESPLHRGWLEEAARRRGTPPRAAELKDPPGLERLLRQRTGLLGPAQVVGVFGPAGSGRTSVLLGLASALRRQGCAVALLDADLATHALRSRLGCAVPPLVVGGLVLPYVQDGMRLQGLDAFWPEAGPLPWQGRELQRVLERYREDVLWGSPDVLLLDLPPLGDPRLGEVAAFFKARCVRVEGALESALAGPGADFSVRNAASGAADAELPYVPGGDWSEIFATRLAPIASALGVKGSGRRS